MKRQSLTSEERACVELKALNGAGMEEAESLAVHGEGKRWCGLALWGES